MGQTINIEHLADIRRLVSKLELLPDSTRWYVPGYAEGAADASEQTRSGERREEA